MTTLRAPLWVRIVSAAVGSAALVLSGLSFYAPQLLFGVEAYPLFMRVATGLLGAAAGGLGVTAVVAAIGGDVAVVQTVMSTLFTVSALIPPVIIYNIGAFNQTDPTGFWAFFLAAAVILAISLPLLLSLLVLNRLRRAAQGGPASQARPASKVVGSAVK